MGTIAQKEVTNLINDNNKNNNLANRDANDFPNLISIAPTTFVNNRANTDFAIKNYNAKDVDAHSQATNSFANT